MASVPGSKLRGEIERASVPCNGCNLCCRGEAIILLADEGDDIASYEHVLVDIPGLPPQAVLKKGADGNCIYLGPTGCTIHDRAPKICKHFDCRGWYLSKTRAERRRMISQGHASKEIFDAGRARLKTLQRI